MADTAHWCICARMRAGCKGLHPALVRRERANRIHDRQRLVYASVVWCIAVHRRRVLTAWRRCCVGGAGRRRVWAKGPYAENLCGCRGDEMGSRLRETHQANRTSRRQRQRFIRNWEAARCSAWDFRIWQPRSRACKLPRSSGSKVWIVHNRQDVIDFHRAGLAALSAAIIRSTEHAASYGFPAPFVIDGRMIAALLSCC